VYLALPITAMYVH